MLITGVLCLLAAAVALAFGLRTLSRPVTADPEQRVLRAVAPAQLAAGVILGAGGALVVVGPPAIGLLALIISLTGALGTLAAGAWQGARYAARQPVPAGGGGCGGDCGCADGGSAPATAATTASTTAVPATAMPFGLLPAEAASVPVESGGCGAGCGCADSDPAPVEPAGGCGSGCGCG